MSMSSPPSHLSGGGRFRERLIASSWGTHRRKTGELDEFLVDSTAISYYPVDEMATISLGEFEQVVLLAILRLGDAAYGVSIRTEIAAQTDREPSPGALYTTLDRLEERG